MSRGKRIRVLPRSVVNRIAAGEIVERPASVVKELVENSLDAGATRVRVNIAGGGLEKISVVDDGRGIDSGDLLLAVQPHATSKLTNEEDLWRISTLGFRGEALASIASISRMEIKSRAPGAIEGARLVAEGDRIGAVSPWTGPEGTVVEVSDLFFNTPVRLRQLGKPGTEASHVASRLRELALGNPHVSFRLVSSDRELLFTSGSGELLEAITELFDSEFATKLLPLHSSDSAIIRGFVGPPELTRARRDRQYLLLHGRAITHPPFQSVLERAYEGFAPTGRHPVAIVDFNVRHDRVDVNVHPTKRRVRFDDDRELAGRLYRAVQGALLSMNVTRWEFPRERDESPADRTDAPEDCGKGTSMAEEQLKYEYLPGRGQIGVNRVYDHLEPLGQVLDSYIVARGPGGLYLVDQHAACERLYYDAALEAIEQGDPPVQRLIAPAVLEVGTRTMECWGQWGHLLTSLGFEVEEFGPESLVVRAVPILAGEPASPAALEEVLSRLAENTSATPTSARAAAALASCRASIKAGEALSPGEVTGLIARMSHLDTPGVCPHGRPTVLAITRDDIERLFRRK